MRIVDTTQRVGVQRMLIYVGDHALADRLTRIAQRLGLHTSVPDDAGDVRRQLVEDQPVLVIVDTTKHTWVGDVARFVDDNEAVLPILLAELDTAEEFLAGISAGIVGLCSPHASDDALERTITSAMESGAAIPRGLVASLVAQVRRGRGYSVSTAAGQVRLTDREWEILQYLVQRRSTREIAEALYVSTGTVRSHVSAVLNKLGASNRDEAVALIQRSPTTSDTERRDRSRS